MTRLLPRALLSLAAAGACALAVAGTAPAAKPLPSDSVLRLADRFTDQDGRAFTLAQRRGKPQVVAMFYSSCKYACPLLIDSGKGVEHALAPAERGKLRILYVSLDPVRDQPKVLSALATQRKLDRTRWTLATTDAAGVRRTAAVRRTPAASVVARDQRERSSMRSEASADSTLGCSRTGSMLT
jgi:protein SCO1/2